MRAAKMKERPTFQLMCQTDVQSIYHMAVLFNCIAESESDLIIDPYLNTICSSA